MTQSITDFLNRTGSVAERSYGRLVAGGAVSKRLLWPGPARTTAPIAAASGVQMTIVSDSVNDAAAGTGVQKINLIYIDGNGDEQQEEVTLNGTTGVTTTATDIRFIQCMHMSAVGSGGAAAGNISATNGGVTYSYVAAGELRCSMAARMVPNGKRLVIDCIFVGGLSGTAAAAVELQLCVSKFNGFDYTDSGLLMPESSFGVQDATCSIMGVDYYADAGTIIGMTVTTDKAATAVGSYHGWFEPL